MATSAGNPPPNDPRHLPFLYDLADLDWPDWDAARLVFADLLEEQGDARADPVRKVDAEVWAGGTWVGLPRNQDPALLRDRMGLFNITPERSCGINIACRRQVLLHFAPLWRLEVRQRRSMSPAGHTDADNVYYDVVDLVTIDIPLLPKPWTGFNDKRMLWKETPLFHTSFTSPSLAAAMAADRKAALPHRQYQVLLPPGVQLPAIVSLH